MYKITIEEKVGELITTTTIETADLEFAKYLVEGRGLVSIESDLPNLNIDKGWQELMQLNKYNKPFTITC